MADAFIGTFFGSLGAVAISLIMLRGRIFGKATAWVGILGFTLLSIFTLWATFVPVLYEVTFYGFGRIGGLFALAWFLLVALRCFKLGRTEKEPSQRHNRGLMISGIRT
jgi:hypothetical protein